MGYFPRRSWVYYLLGCKVQVSHSSKVLFARHCSRSRGLSSHFETGHFTHEEDYHLTAMLDTPAPAPLGFRARAPFGEGFQDGAGRRPTTRRGKDKPVHADRLSPPEKLPWSHCVVRTVSMRLGPLRPLWVEEIVGVNTPDVIQRTRVFPWFR